MRRNLRYSSQLLVVLPSTAVVADVDAIPDERFAEGLSDPGKVSSPSSGFGSAFKKVSATSTAPPLTYGGWGGSEHR